MPSTFTWLDYSEHERRKMLDVIELFGERTTRDELGIGGVRDAFADLLFPGTSTIQTRARYFLLVPWGYLQLEHRAVASATIAIRARKLEAELMLAIEASDDSAGLIGRLARENVRRLPSSVYWQGLATWGIRLFPGSQDEYHRSLDLFYVRRRSRRTAHQDFDGEAIADPDLHNWHPGLPPAPEGFTRQLTFTLERHEAEYLRERVLTNCSQSLLAFLVRERIQIYDAPFAWDLPDELPSILRQQLEHARNFSEVIWGVQLLYNLMLAELTGWQEMIERYRGLLDEWWLIVIQRQQHLAKWDRRAFWRIVFQGNPRINVRAKGFINQWIDRVLATQRQQALVDDPGTRQLVEHRERQLKGGLARLHNQRARELWPGAAGAARLDLRWYSAQRILGDILAALEPSDA